MSDFLGEIREFGGEAPPIGWLFSCGQVFNIEGNEDLFAAIGKIHGGDGVNTFTLPTLLHPLRPNANYIIKVS